MDNPAADEILDIEIDIDGAGLSPPPARSNAALSGGVAKPAALNVGIITALAPSGGTAPAKTWAWW